jgi:hypothetical protein
MGAPQSALVGIAITPELEIIFDLVEKSRKFPNIARDPRVAFLIGWPGEVKVQYEGVARQISSAQLGPYPEIYLRKFTDAPKSPEVGRHNVLRGHADVDSLQRLRPNPAGNCPLRVLKRSIPELFLVRVETAGRFAA